MYRHPIFRFSLFAPLFSALMMLVIWLTTLTSDAQASQIPVSNHSTNALADTYTFLPIIPRGVGRPCIFQESGGLIVMEVESVSPVELWTRETTVPGYLGQAYYTWRGPDLFGTPGIGVLNYPISVTMPGLYSLRFHNYHSHPDSTLENDAFVKLDSGGWIKAFSGTGQVWTWDLAFDYGNHVLGPAEYHLSAGRHLFQISARSANFSIDRIVLYMGVDGRDPNLPESSCGYAD